MEAHILLCTIVELKKEYLQRRTASLPSSILALSSLQQPTDETAFRG